MPACRPLTRIDTLELKYQIFKKLGRRKAEKYFYGLSRLLSLKLGRMEFEKLVFSTVGKENIGLHNLFVRSILSNACLGHVSPSKETITGNSRSSKASNGQFGDLLLMSLRRGRSISSRDHKSSNRLSPLRPYGKMLNESSQEVTNSCYPQRSLEQQSAPEFMSIGSKAPLEVVSVEDGEEVEQVKGSPCVESRSPVRPPLGITMSSGSYSRKVPWLDNVATSNLSLPYIFETCHNSGELPDTRSLSKRLKHKLEAEGLVLLADCVNLLNGSLDLYLKRLIRPCLELARARCNTASHVSGTISQKSGSQQEQFWKSIQLYSASLQDFRVAMELNPQLLGVDWPEQLEKICLHYMEE